MSEQLNLNWNSYEVNLGTSLKNFRKSRDFYDVTLACEDGQVQCHKLVLSACSPLLLKILRQNLHPHPLLYLKGVKFKQLLSVLDFMYDGQVNVSREDLMLFMATAEELKVKGLTQGGDSNEVKEAGSPAPVKKRQIDEKGPVIISSQSLAGHAATEPDLDQFIFLPEEAIKAPAYKDSPLPPLTRVLAQNPFALPNFDNVLARGEYGNSNLQPRSGVPRDEVQGGNSSIVDTENNNDIGLENSDDLESIKALSKKCKSMIFKREDGYYHCLVCGFKNEKRPSVRKHVECHMPSQHKVCNVCNKSFKNRNSLYSHKNIYHKVSKLKETINSLRDDIISAATSEVASANQAQQTLHEEGAHSLGFETESNFESGIKCGKSFDKERVPLDVKRIKLEGETEEGLAGLNEKADSGNEWEDIDEQSEKESDNEDADGNNEFIESGESSDESVVIHEEGKTAVDKTFDESMEMVKGTTDSWDMMF